MRLSIRHGLFLIVVLSQAAPMAIQSGWTALQGNATTDSAITRAGAGSLRVESNGVAAMIYSPPVPLQLGKRYEVSGWVRTEGVEVRDKDRSPIAMGAALSMASMPFDVHSESIAGTRDWTRLHLRFIATRAEDHIVLAVGNGGDFRGKAWFEGVTIDETSNQDAWPTREAVQVFGPAYRYPKGGWIYLHIEGHAYERGYQHGHLMSREIVGYIDRCAAELDSKSKERAWDWGRTTASALFLRGYDQEILEEMKGIADGAANAGAKWNDRKVDLLDILAANSITELGVLDEAIPLTPTGLEGLHLTPPEYYDHTKETGITERCSAFAATGPATRDGKMIIAHVTMWPLTLAEQTNIMLDVKPALGHRVLMQSFPGGIQSGTDWYQNDDGVVLTETTIRQSPFNLEGLPESFRARKAIQYGDNIDKVVEYLGTRNNGLYTNEWLIGDAKNNEIAMYELGTYKTKLYRSSRGEWFGGTEGFYWGDNNAKDLNVRLEYAPDPAGAPQFLPYVPSDRDLKWQQLYGEHKGHIDEQLAFLAFRTAPLVTSSTMDAKVATADMASRMMVWATFGKPNQREWVPSDWEKEHYIKNAGLYPSGYRLFTTDPPPALPAAAVKKEEPKKDDTKKVSPYENRLWKGWLLPASDSDDWLIAGSAAYYRDLQSDDLEKAVEARRASYRRAALLQSDATARLQLEQAKGALLLDELRRSMGDDKFFRLINDFFTANTGKTVGANAFIAAAGEKQKPIFEEWLKTVGLPKDTGSPIYLASDLRPMGGAITRAILVYGTVMEAGANRHAAELLQKRLLNWYESEVPIRKDFEVTDEELQARNVIFIGRPETNSALASWSAKLRLQYNGAVFHVGGAAHPSENESLVLAAPSPADPKRMVLVLAGNSPLETVRAVSQSFERTEYAVYDSGKLSVSGFEKATR